ncbi:MAG: DUF1987 domain-containing protein [Bacteroidetes bacterium]|nr:DUF1987 domain-containing protein [Bacteroidota bacterium]
MEAIRLQPTQKTPEISFSRDGRLLMKGNSIPEHSTDFFKPLCDWLDEYVKKPAGITEFTIQMNYINSSSSKYLMMMLKILEKADSASSRVFVNWEYEEDDFSLQELGEEFQSELKIPINFVLI